MQIVAALILPGLALVFSIIFAGLWRVDNARPHLFGLSGGFFALFITMAIGILVPSLEPIPFLPLLNVVACFSVVAIMWGANKRLGQRLPLVSMVAFSLISSIALYFALRAGDLETT